jgi:2-polyprenyl-6-hydroxyphenyl methylase/3-demethylubiquinone-9 3-methyltransferase
MCSAHSSDTPRTLDPVEVARFSEIADAWWDPEGKFRPLHQLGPARLGFIRSQLVKHLGLSAEGLRPLAAIRVLDIGCGGGLIAEPIARLGATVTGIDPAEENIRVAEAHSRPQGLAIDYRVAQVEDLKRAGETFDAVLCLEVVEHVPDVGRFLQCCAALVRPGGVMILSTINRTVKAYALAIIGAEYVLRWLPAGTHQWERFVTPEELERHLAAAGLAMRDVAGLVYNPLIDRWTLGQDTGVNYLAAATREVAPSVPIPEFAHARCQAPERTSES